MSKLSRLSLVVFSLLICFVSSLQAQEPKDVLGALRYRHIGPVGNRVTSVAGVAGQPNIYYVGAASGGIFKTIDGGTHWEPIFDGQPVSSIGSLAIAPSDAGHRLGRHRRSAHSQSHLRRRRHLQIHRRRQDLEVDGTGKNRAHRSHRYRSEKSGRGAGGGDGPQLWPATGARRVSHDRRRQNLGARFVCRRKHRRV